MLQRPTRIDIGGDNPTHQLVVRCEPSSPSVSVLSLEIGKTSSDKNGNTGIIQIYHTDPDKVNVISVDSSLNTRLTISGKISAIGSHLTLTLSDPPCSDAGWYYCAVNASLTSSMAPEVSSDYANISYRCKCLRPAYILYSQCKL